MSDSITIMKQASFSRTYFTIDNVRTMKTGQPTVFSLKILQDYLKRQRTSQKSFISFLNTLNRMRAPAIPAIKNVTIPALFTT